MKKEKDINKIKEPLWRQQLIGRWSGYCQEQIFIYIEISGKTYSKKMNHYFLKDDKILSSSYEADIICNVDEPEFKIIKTHNYDPEKHQWVKKNNIEEGNFCKCFVNEESLKIIYYNQKGEILFTSSFTRIK